MFLKIMKLIGQTAALIMFAAWLFAGASENAFVNYPRAPSQSDGKVVPYAVKGIVVYITQEQRQLVSWANWIIIGSTTVALVVSLIHKEDQFKSATTRQRPLSSNWIVRGGEVSNSGQRKSFIFSISRKIIGTISAAIALAVWIFYGHLDNTFMWYPKVPNQADGKTIPHTVNGIIVYINQEQQHLLSQMHWIMIGSVLILLIVMLNQLGNPFRSLK